MDIGTLVALPGTQPYIRTCIRRITRLPEPDIEDITQNVLIRSLGFRRPDYVVTAADEMRAWWKYLQIVTHSATVTYLRKRHNKDVLNAALRVDDLTRTVSPEAESVSARSQRVAEMWIDIDRLLGRVTETRAGDVLRRRLADESTEDIAVALGIPERTVYHEDRRVRKVAKTMGIRW